MIQDKISGVQAPAAYENGIILAGPVEEAKKSHQGRRMIRERILARGKDHIYNMTGLERTFPLEPEDLPGLENQFTFYAYFMGEAEKLAIKQMGGVPIHHSAVMCNRVTSAMLAVMLALINKGDRVLSVVQKGRSHPSVQQAVNLVGGSFYEVIGVDAVEAAIQKGPWKMLVITPLTPSKYHIPAADVRRAIKLGNDADILVFADDAHMISRCVFYDEPRTFALGEVDAAVWSLDKHVPGPRGAAIVARQDMMDRIQGQVFQFGLEAQSGHNVAMLRGMQALDTTRIEDASQLSRQAYDRFRRRYGQRIYQAGPGVAFSAEDYTRVVLERVKEQSVSLVDSEISTAGCFLLLREYGIVTIPITGYPGAAPTFRLMMHPDGRRFGLDNLEAAVDATIDSTAALIQDPDAMRTLLLGDE